MRAIFTHARRFEQHLRERMLRSNTVSTYMRMLRALYNRALRAGLVKYIPGLFSDVYTGTCADAKRALVPVQMGKVLVAPEQEVKELEYAKTKMGTPAYLTGSYTGSTGTAALATPVNPAVNITSAGHTVIYWFYIFPNEESTHTALVLEGTFKKNTSDTGRTMYYPIIINKNQTGTTITGTSDTGDSHIRRNTTYTIKATIKGEGTTDPAYGRIYIRRFVLGEREFIL